MDHQDFIKEQLRIDLHLCVGIPIGTTAKGWTVVATEPVTWERDDPRGGKIRCVYDRVPPVLLYVQEEENKEKNEWVYVEERSDK
jgi:hypothetical protein